MNGIRLLVLHANSLLIATVCCGTLLSQTDPRTQYGWQINKVDGVLEYIVQASPFQIRQMQEPGANGRTQELQSDPPQWIVGRFGRIVVKIGEDQLPREGTREQIEARFPRVSDAADDIAAVLGNNGKFKDLESPVVNVNQNGSGLPYPNSPNLIDSLNQSTGGNGASASQRFLSDAQGSGQSVPMPPTSQLSGQSGGSKYLSDQSSGLDGLGYGTGSGSSATGQRNTAADWRTQAAQGSGAGSDRAYAGNVPSLTAESAFDLQGQNNRYPSPQNNLQNRPGSNLAVSTGANRGQSNLGPSSQGQVQPPYGSQGSQYGYGNQQGMSQPNNRPQQSQVPLNQQNAANAANAGMYAGNQGMGQPGYPANGMGNSNANMQNSFAGYPNGQQPTHIASNPLPSTGQGYTSGLPTTTANTQGRPSDDNAITNAAARLLLEEKMKQEKNEKDSEASPSDLAKQAGNQTNAGNQATASGAGPSERWLSVFILISLIVNFYLVVLLRKLLTRYRTLLSNVRSQAA